MNNFYPTPKEIVTYLDKYIIGQDKAKKLVAIALRNRWRRKQTPEELRHEIMPNNIIMIGPTGVGKTEIARRLANLAQAPFIKVEASKFTEVGYVGRDVESMTRDLVDISINMVKNEKSEVLREKAEQNTIERLLDLLLTPIKRPTSSTDNLEKQDSIAKTREKLKTKLLNGKLDKREIEIDTPLNKFPVMEIFSPMGMEEMGINFQEMLSGIVPKKTKQRKMTVKDAHKYLFNEEIDKLTNMDDVIAEALERVQGTGIIFIDEIDKIVGNSNRGGPDVSREGVQRDILPIVEGSSIMTKYGMVRTDHILFIAAGAFHASSPSDLVPELQGRFPIRVELDSLAARDLERILVEPEASLVKQYKAMLKSEGVDITFDKAAVKRIAQYAERVNNEAENIGARRLQTVLTTLLEDILFEPPKDKKRIKISAKMVERELDPIVENEDLSKYIL
ncbi:MAG: ATP-dependent protease ATPase subunit HslU [candidate division Zixibacteria bacterium]|nr:ATP-dependent protease ATPase subunit HslU [candidate division Zixibacteria bacterium]